MVNKLKTMIIGIKSLKRKYNKLLGKKLSYLRFG